MPLVRIPGVFAPHPETTLLASVLEAGHDQPPRHALDLCTGTGVLALALARSGAHDVTAVDLSRRAAFNVRVNARLAGVRVRALCGDLFGPVGRRRFDLITSNPPYVPAPASTEPPRGRLRAYDAGLDGRVLLDRICADVPRHLVAGGRLLLTHSSLSGVEESVRQLRAAGLGAEVVATARAPLGPVMSARAAFFEEQGLLAPGVREEELVVIRAEAPLTLAPPRAMRPPRTRPSIPVSLETGQLV